MEWFSRSVKACFDMPDAYDRIRLFQSPRWGGSYEAMLSLGCDCVDTGRFDTEVPMQLVYSMVEAINEAYRFEGLNQLEPLLAATRVEKALQGCLQGYLRKSPERQSEFDLFKTTYLFHAGRAAEAATLFATIPEEHRNGLRRLHLDKLAESKAPGPAHEKTTTNNF